MTSLPEVTLFCLDCEDAERAARVMRHCESLCSFGGSALLTSEQTDYPHVKVAKIGSGDRVEGLMLYSEFMLREAYKHVATSHVLTVQHDGWVLNAESWDPAWLEFDYIGPLFIQVGEVGSGGFSFRSRRLMEWVAKNLPPFNGMKGYNGYVWEDGVICYALRQKLEAAGFLFAPPEIAARFAFGGNPTHYCPEPFGFHGFYALDTLLGGTGENIPRTP